MPQWNVSTLETPRVFYLRDGSTLADAAEKVSRLAADEFRMASAFAVVSRTPIVFDTFGATPLLQYAAGKPVVLLVAGEKFSIKTDLITERGLAQLDGEPVISKVREGDLLQLLRDDAGACAFEQHGNYHFVTPSLTHTTRFLRIGDLLDDLETLDRLAFWLRPFAGKADAILVDSWSIASVILRTLQLDRLDLPFDCLPEHPTHNSAGCRRVVERLLSRVPTGGKLVAFVSISGSGKLVEHITELLGERTRAGLAFECWSLFGYENEHAPKLCGCFALAPERQTYTNDNCQLCAQGSVPIYIDPAAYHLKSLRESKVLIPKKYFEPARAFVERYNGARGVFLVHHDDQNDGRHHAFDFHMDALISTPQFLSKFKQVLKSIRTRVDLVIAPNHEPGKKLAAMATAQLACPFAINDTLERNKLSADEIKFLSDATNILIVDDVVNTGSRLKTYIQFLREGRYGEFASVNYLVAVARTSSPQNLDALSKSLVAGHDWKGGFHFVEEIILPSWNEQQCPWCSEFDFLSRLGGSFARPPQWLSERLAKLRNRTIGISDEPLLLLPGVRSLVLGDQSPICSGGTSSMTALFVIASGLQRMRSETDPGKQLHPGFPVGNVIDPKNISDRYTEGLIRAILLRLIQRAEWGQVAGIEIRNLMLRELAQANQKIMAGELFFALGKHSLPPISIREFESVFLGFLQEDLHQIAAAFVRA